MASAAARAASVLPEPARLRYDVSATIHGLQYHADAELLWQPDGAQQRYRLRFEFRALSMLLRSQTSTGLLNAQGLAPLHFSDQARGKERSATFDRERQLVTFSAGTPDAALEAGTQDRLSVLLQLAALIAGNPARFTEGSRIDIPTVGPTDAQPWQFTVLAEESLTAAGRQVRTLKLERNPRDAKDQRIEVWFAPTLNYLPVQLRITQQDGESALQRLKGIEKP